MELASILDAVSRAGIIGLLLIIILSGARGDWVFGWVYRSLLNELERCRHDRDKWRDLALSSTGIAEELVERMRNGS
jgi:hypothetical protein